MGKRDEPFNNPFRDLETSLRPKARNRPRAAPASPPSGEPHRRKPPARPSNAPATPPARPASPEPAHAEDDVEVFLAAVADVQRFDDDRGSLPTPRSTKPSAAVPFAAEEQEALEALTRLVEGRDTFDIVDSDEFIEGCVRGLDPRIIRRLKRGEFTFREHLDLHGMTKEMARKEVEIFIEEQRAEKARCVLIVHGRGKNSKDNVPVLKEALSAWLSRGRVGRSVLAFCTARPHDGGAGAMYVLLRR